MFDLTPTGIRFTLEGHPQNDQYGLALQIVESGIAYDVEGGFLEIGWSDVYGLLSEDPDAARLLGLPASNDSIVPILAESGTLGETFTVQIDGWAHAQSRAQVAPYRNPPVGGVIDLDGIGRLLVDRGVWDLLDRIRKLNRLTPGERSRLDNRIHWAGIRRAALACGAHLSPYLAQTIVLIPQHLRLDASPTRTDGVLEVRPDFDGAPEGWLDAFDRSAEVNEAYRLNTADGEVQIVLHGGVREILTEIKQRMPRRRIAGAAAQRLIRNPYTLLGPAATDVLDPEHAERQLAEHEAGASRFRFAVANDDGHLTSCGVLVEADTDEDSSGSFVMFATAQQLRNFITLYSRSLDAGYIAVSWHGHRLLVDELGASQIPAMREALREMTGDHTPHADEPQPTFDLPVARPLDLSELSDRIEGIDIETRFSIIRVPSTVATGGWVPDSDDVIAVVTTIDVDGADAPISLTVADLEALRASIDSGDPITVPSSGRTLTPEQARDIVDHVPPIRATPRTSDEDDTAQDEQPIRAKSPSERTTIIARANIDRLEYAANRASDLAAASDAAPALPKSLRPEITLLPHQQQCVAWLQHLWNAGPDSCAGALLADDMGLGKTLQALAFIIAEREKDPALPPALVVAPVSLLENWRREIENFFDAPRLHSQVFAATEARRWKASQAELAAEDIERGLLTQLREGWTQDASLVITTYDTLLNYEVSFAREAWSVVVLDEAQAIKNPNALRTRSVWKLKSRFRLACTGTPVENSLTDLWSIFDFIQPSLLGPVNEFGRRYTKAIETGGELRQERIEELRALIEPQVKRRTKAEVVKDLPPKVFDQDCRALEMSKDQLQRYLGMIDGWRDSEPSERMPMIQLIRELARINSDFSLLAEPDRAAESAADLAAVNPKFEWLLATLDRIRDHGEKALVFVELRAVQRHLRRHLHERYGLEIDIINGDTSTNPRSEASRQAIIDAFSERDGFDVMLLSPVAAGVGLNIQAANHVIHYMRHWNPAKEDQATDRAYRIGQQRPVTVYTPIVSLGGDIDFPSFDEKLDLLLSAKRELASDMLHGQDQVSGDELADLVSSAIPTT